MLRKSDFTFFRQFRLDSI